MSKSSREFKDIYGTIPDHEVLIVQRSLEVIQRSGAQVDMTKFIDGLMSDFGYEWEDFEDNAGRYLPKGKEELAENKDSRQRLAVNQFFKALNGQRTPQQLEAIALDHELYYLVFTYTNLFEQKGFRALMASLQKKQPLSPISFLDEVAKGYGYEWIETEKAYKPLSERFDLKVYPPEYQVAFDISDDEAVHRVLNFHSSLGRKITGVTVVDYREKGVVVYTVSGNAPHRVLRQTHWDDPSLSPSEVDGYAGSWHVFAGPSKIQMRRAHLLAQQLDANVEVKVCEPEDLEQFSEVPSLGRHFEALTLSDLFPKK